MEKPFKVIDESNFDYLVRKETPGYAVSVTWAIPRKTPKGYLGMKHHWIKKRIENKDEALLQFENWKEDYVPKFHKKEIVALYITFMPITFYYVTCPNCGNDAEILDWMVMMGMSKEGSYGVHYIICKHCCSSSDPMDALYNVVGECEVMLMGNREEEKEITLRFNNACIKWEDWVNDNSKN